jgi:hypothetical protein
MPRYFFHLEDDRTQLKDEEGMALPDAEAAWYQAVRSARDLIKADLHLGSSWRGRRLEIEDDQGLPVDQVRFEEVANYAF